MRFFFSCSELGLGHVNRTLLLGKKLEKRGHTVSFFSGGIAYDLLRHEFENVYSCRPVAWYQSNYGIIVSASALNILLPLPLFNQKNKRLEIKRSVSQELVYRYYDLRKNIRKIQPDAIISDGDLLSLRLANKFKIPCVYVTNVIRLSVGLPAFFYPGQRLTERYIRKCREIIVPDIPKYTVCSYNLGNLDKIGIEDKVKMVGTFFDTKYETRSASFIFASVSGPLGTRARMIRQLIPALSRLECRSVISLGEPMSKLKKEIGNCEIRGWLNQRERRNLMENAEIVIFSGSHGTCFEVIGCRKPSICMPTQPEQIGNARKLADLHCSICIENKEQIKSAIERIREKKTSYVQNVSVLADHASKFKGLDAAVNIVESLS